MKKIIIFQIKFKIILFITLIKIIKIIKIKIKFPPSKKILKLTPMVKNSGLWVLIDKIKPNKIHKNNKIIKMKQAFLKTLLFLI
jgi:hypothetical protein